MVFFEDALVAEGRLLISLLVAARGFPNPLRLIGLHDRSNRPSPVALPQPRLRRLHRAAAGRQDVAQVPLGQRRKIDLGSSGGCRGVVDDHRPVPPVAASPFTGFVEVAIGLPFVKLVTLNEYAQAPVHVFADAAILPFAATLRKIWSVPLLSNSVTGEHVVAALVRVGPVWTVPQAPELTDAWYKMGSTPAFPQT